MALKVKLVPINSKTLFQADGLASRETIGKSFAGMVAKDIARVDRENAAIVGRSVPHSIAVGSAEVAALPSFIDPAAHVIARWKLEVGAVAYAWETLHRAGPALKGAYRKSHRIYADGVEVSGPEACAGSSEVLILSIVPYARKIERGRKRYAPGAVYQAVAAMTAARYGNIGKVKFTYAEPEGAAPELRRWAMTNAYGVAPAQWKRKGNSQSAANANKQRRQMQKNVRQPAILFIF